MSSSHLLKFTSEDEAREVLKPFGFVVFSPTFGDCWALFVDGRHSVSRIFLGNSEYKLQVTLLVEIEGFNEVLEKYKQE